MKESCTHLDEILEAETGIIQRHINAHKYFMGKQEQRDIGHEEAIIDFVDKYAWIMREFYCGYCCQERHECQMAQRYIPNGNYKNIR